MNDIKIGVEKQNGTSGLNKIHGITSSLDEILSEHQRRLDQLEVTFNNKIASLEAKLLERDARIKELENKDIENMSNNVDLANTKLDNVLERIGKLLPNINEVAELKHEHLEEMPSTAGETPTVQIAGKTDLVSAHTADENQYKNSIIENVEIFELNKLIEIMQIQEKRESLLKNDKSLDGLI